jgi:hypothetical protein
VTSAAPAVEVMAGHASPSHTGINDIAIVVRMVMSNATGFVG